MATELHKLEDQEDRSKPIPARLAVEANTLTHHFGTRKALDQVSLTVNQGTLFGILGPNGSGKTTLFRMLATLLKPAAGHIFIDGIDAATGRESALTKIGVVFQSPSLDDKLTVLENLIHQGWLYGMRKAQSKHRATSLLEQFNILDRARDRVETLSGGLKRRVEITKAMLHQPEILILDEPGTGLDLTSRQDLLRTLEQLRDHQSVTILLTTHLMDEADRCNTIAILDEGRLVALGSPASLKRRTGGDVVTIQTDNPSRLADWVSKRFEVQAVVVNDTVQVNAMDGHQWVPVIARNFGDDVKSITVGKPSLGDAFVRLTGHSFDEQQVGSTDERQIGLTNKHPLVQRENLREEGNS